VNTSEPDDQNDDEETERRRDEIIKRMIATPPQLHKPKKGASRSPRPRSARAFSAEADAGSAQKML
jgi:hypothetical protein